MKLKVGDTLPDAQMSVIVDGGPALVSLSEKLAGKKAVIFALPGAFTRTCSASHLPSFISAMDDLKAKGIDAVFCISVNDPFVMHAWGESSGANAAGIEMLGDADASFTMAIGAEFSAPPIGLLNRSSRYSALVEDVPELGGYSLSRRVSGAPQPRLHRSR